MPRWFLDPALGPCHNLSWQQKLQGTTVIFKLWITLDPSSPLLSHEHCTTPLPLASVCGWKAMQSDWPNLLQHETNQIAAIPSFNLFPRMHATVLCLFFHHLCQNAEKNQVTVAGLVQGGDLLFTTATFHQLKHRQRSFTNICQTLQTKPRNGKTTVLKEKTVSNNKR